MSGSLPRPQMEQVWKIPSVGVPGEDTGAWRSSLGNS